MNVAEDERHHEVEAKYRLRDPAEFVAALAAHGIQLSEASSQDDQAYAPAGWSYGMSKIGVPFARLRTQDGRHLFTVKKPVDNALACLEHESEVLDRAQMHSALVLMGWVPTVRIVKQRRAGAWGETALCLDLVDGLGAFVELERMVNSRESGSQVQVDLDFMIRALGVPVERITETYDSLIWALTVTSGETTPA